MQDLEGKTAFVTGGASGIGLGIARALLAAGANVVITDVREDHLAAARKLIAQTGYADSAHFVRFDITDRPAFAAAADETIAHFGKVHILVNNAGVGLIGPLKQATFADWDWGIDVNIKGVVNGVVTFLPRLLAHGEGGHIVNTASMAGLLPPPGAAIYNMTKAAVIGLSESLRSDLAGDNIGVSAFCPGPVQSNIAKTRELRPEQYRRDSGYAEFEKTLVQRPIDPLWMDPLECGERVVEGIRRNEIYILTHREFREGVAERCEAILAAFPDEPVNAERAAAIGFLTSNPIYRAQLEAARQRQHG